MSNKSSAIKHVWFDVNGTLIPGTFKTLAILREIIPISIFTSFSLSETLTFLQEINIDENWFTSVLTSEQVPDGKASLLGFKLAVEKSGVPSGENMYVGDRVSADIRPARAVGMQTCLMYSRSYEADYCFEKFEELLSLFGRA